MKTLVTIMVILTSGNLNLGAQSHSSVVEGIKNKFEDQITRVHREKVFLDTDRSLYITGETIWLSAYCTDAAVHIPTDLSKVLNIELIDSEGQSVKQERIELSGGFGKGQMFVSADITSGKYMLRAFTNWMKNFDHSFVFQKTLNIINPSTKPNEEVEQQSNQSVMINFFPEGGELVTGLKSKVAVRAADNFGMGQALTGIVYDNDDTEVARFSTSAQGYSSFWLLPEQDKAYFARVAYKAEIKKYNLPAVRNKGVTMTVSMTGQGNFNISLNATERSPEPFYLVVHTRGIIERISPVGLDTQKHVQVTLENLPAGISHITLLDHTLNPQCDRLVFKYPQNNEYLSLQQEKGGYRKREKVVLNLGLHKAGPSNEGKGQARLSVSVFRSHGSIRQSDNITANLLLTSDIKGAVSTAPTDFDPDNQSNVQQMDLIMLTHDWRRFDLKGVHNNQPINLTYPAETHAPILSGKLQNMEKYPKSIQMSFFGKASILNSLDIDPDGIFHFEVPVRVTNDKVHFFTMKEPLNSNQIKLHSPFDLNFETKFNPKLNYATGTKQYLESLNTNIQISQIYRDYNHINGIPPKTEPINTHFYGQPDYLYPLDNYTRFETVRDLFIEYIRSVLIRKKNKKTGFYVVDDRVLPGSAMTMIDGIPIFDPEFILNYDPLKVEKIGVITGRYYAGGLSFDGIVNFTTYNGDFGGQELPAYMIEKAYHGLQQTRAFYSPDHVLHQHLPKRIPDYRNTLYWNPDVRITNNEQVTLQFYTGDDTGLYQIEINGITNTGEPIHMSQEFKVSEGLP